jgi:hypothetical protein
MADLQFSWKDVNELTRRLSSVAHELSEAEWALLLAIFAIAAGQVESAPDKASGTLPAAEISDSPQQAESPRRQNSADLVNQLLHAYIPGPPPSIPWAIKITPPPEPIRGPEPNGDKQ